MDKEIAPFKLIGHSYQIADTGDYDGHYEITNGKVSIFTQDDNAEVLEPIVTAINESGCKFYLDDADKVEIFLLKEEIKELKSKAAMELQLPVKFMKWVNDEDNSFYLYDEDEWIDSAENSDAKLNCEELFNYWLENVYENGK